MDRRVVLKFDFVELGDSFLVDDQFERGINTGEKIEVIGGEVGVVFFIGFDFFNDLFVLF